MTWDVRLLNAWTADRYQEAEDSRLARLTREARRAGGAARRRGRWRLMGKRLFGR